MALCLSPWAHAGLSVCLTRGWSTPWGNCSSRRGEGTSCKPPRGVLPTPAQTGGTPNPLPEVSSPSLHQGRLSPTCFSLHVPLAARGVQHSALRAAFGSGSGREEPQLIQGSIHTECPRRQPAPCCGSPISSPSFWCSSLSEGLATSTALGRMLRNPLWSPAELGGGKGMQGGVGQGSGKGCWCRGGGR